MRFQQTLTLRHLRLVATLGKTLSLSRAAESLHTSQSALSRTLAEVESLIGERLFDRTTRRVTPTLFGRSLVWHAEQILNQLDRAESDLDALARGVNSALDVGVMGAFSPPCLVETLRLATERMPGVMVRLHSNFADGLITDLIQGRCEIAITHFDLRQFGSEAVVAEELYAERVAVLCAASHPLARRRSVRWKDLAGRPWVLGPLETATRRIVERNLLLHTASRSGALVESMDLHYVIALVRDGGMLTALPSRLARWWETSGGLRCLAIAEEARHSPVCLARLRSREPSEPARIFRDCVLEASRKITARDS